MVDGSRKLDERNSSNAQIRTLLEEQRQMVIEEYLEKVGHHELQAAHAEEERRLLQGQLWRQKLEFREAHQQSLTEMEELRKFQSSTFDTIARRKLIEDQNTTLELSGILQELHNEVNCINESKDFQDAESVRSGNSHVTSQPMLFPKHPFLEGLLRPSFVSPRRKEGPPCTWDAGGLEKLPFTQNIRISSWSFDMVGHAKKCVERYCELANKTIQQLYKVSTPCIDDHHFKEEETKSVGELSSTCSQIVLK